MIEPVDHLTPWTVFLGTVVLLVLGLITIGSQTLKASKHNPGDALKVE